MELLDLTALDQSAGLARGDFSAEDLMHATLDRIGEVNGSLNAIVSLQDPDQLIADAQAADAGPRAGWLHGMPIAIKDLANVKDMPTSMGSPLFADFIAPQDDLMVARIKAAGAIVIGKTNTPEFGLGSNTFNPVHGATVNPYDHSKTAGGSSGGAAVALAARMLSVADGSDMMGSLRNPAAWNNVYGMRPSWGTVPAEPVGDMFMHQLSTSGPMARTPADLAALADVMTGPDPRQPNGVDTAPLLPQLAAPVVPMRLGWLGEWGLPFEEGIIPLSEAAMDTMRDLGQTVENVAPPFEMRALWQSWIDLRSFSVAATAGAHYDTPNQRALLKPAAVWEVERGLSLTPRALYEASGIRSDWFRCAAQLFEKYDVLVLPSTQVWPYSIDDEYPTRIGDVALDTYHRWMQIVIPASLIGLPVVNVPIGFGANGLPAGVQLIGPRGSDGKLLQLAQVWHQATDWPNQRPPIL